MEGPGLPGGSINYQGHLLRLMLWRVSAGSDAKLKNYFQRLFPENVETVYVVKQLSSLAELLEELPGSGFVGRKFWGQRLGLSMFRPNICRQLFSSFSCPPLNHSLEGKFEHLNEPRQWLPFAITVDWRIWAFFFKYQPLRSPGGLILTHSHIMTAVDNVARYDTAEQRLHEALYQWQLHNQDGLKRLQSEEVTS